MAQSIEELRRQLQNYGRDPNSLRSQQPLTFEELEFLKNSFQGPMQQKPKLSGAEMWEQWGPEQRAPSPAPAPQSMAPQRPTMDTLAEQQRMPNVNEPGTLVKRTFPGKQFTPEGEDIKSIADRVRGDVALGVEKDTRRMEAENNRDVLGRIFGAFEKSDYRPAAQMALRTGAHIRAGEPVYQFPEKRDSGAIDPARAAYLQTQMGFLDLKNRQEERMAKQGAGYLRLGETKEVRHQKAHERVPTHVGEKLTQNMNALSHINEIRNHIDLGKIGPIWGRIRSSMIALGYGDPDLAVDNASIIAMFASYVKGISGVAVSEKEFVRLYPSIPNIKQSPEMFKALLSRFENQIKNEYYNRIEGLRLEGRDVSGYELESRKPTVGGGEQRIQEEGDLQFHDPNTNQSWSFPGNMPEDELRRFKEAHEDAVQIMKIGE